MEFADRSLTCSSDRIHLRDDPLVYQFESETEMTMVLTEVLQLEKSRLQASVMDVSTAPTGFEQKVETVAEDSLAQTGMD